MNATIYIGPVIAFATTTLLILLLRPLAIRTGLLDFPNERSSHKRPTPLIGGVAIYLAVGAAYSVPAAIGLMPINREYASFFVAGLILVSIGALSASTRSARS